METKMISSSKSWGRVAAVAGVTFLAACGMENRQMVSTPPPPPPASAHASVYQVAFAAGSYEINLAGQRAIEDVSSVVDGNKRALVTIVGRTDATGSADYNMRLSQKRAAAVRDKLLSLGKIDPTHVDTAWTGEERQDVGTYNQVAESRNRVVDIYIH
jgi:outer membrane protein OmpA-like peptidoglycan-associated protein